MCGVFFASAMASVLCLVYVGLSGRFFSVWFYS